MLLANAKDDRLEEFWETAHSRGGWRRLQNLRFELATSFSYSVWDMDPRPTQIHNQDRSRGTYEMLLHLGIPTIPFLFCAAPEDYENAAQWLAERPGIGAIADLAQFYQTDEDFEEFVIRLRRLLDLVRRRLRVVVVGVCSRARIRTLYEEFGDVTVVCGEPVYKAMRAGHEMFDDLSSAVAPLFTRDQLIVKNIDVLTRVCRDEARLLGD